MLHNFTQYFENGIVFVAKLFAHIIKNNYLCTRNNTLGNTNANLTNNNQ